MSGERRVKDNIHIAGASIFWRNFQGKKTEFNDEGNRNFCVRLDDDLATKLEDDGWNVKYLKPRDDDPEQYEQPYMKVKVRFNPYPPIAFLINSKGKKRLSEETIGQLDWTRIKNCDLIISPYNYPAMVDKKGKVLRPEGVAAYMKAIYVRILEDEFAEKYNDLPDLDDEPDEAYENEED